MRSARALRAGWLALGLGLATLLGPAAGGASAHAYLTGSSPSDGESLATAPTTVRLEFSEHLVVESTRIVVTDSAGREYPLRALRAEPIETGLQSAEAEPGAGLEGAVADTEAPLAIVAGIPPLRPGAYHLAWESLSSDDLHRTAGGLTFGIGTAVDATGVSEAPPDPVDAARRLALFLGLSLALGGAVVGRLAHRRDGEEMTTVEARCARIGVVGALLTAGSAAVWLLLDAVRAGGWVASGTYATHWALREAALLILAVLLARRAPVWLVAAAALGACVATASLGHSGLTGGATWVTASALHLLTATAWAGSVALLGWVALRHRALDLPRGQVTAIMRRFLWPATVSVSIVAVTGIYLASDVVVSVDAALTTSYGRLLLAKLAVVALAGLLAAGTSRRLHRGNRAPAEPSSPGDPADRTARTRVAGPALRSRRIAAEAGLLGLALVLAAAITSGQPPISPLLVDAVDGQSQTLDRTVGDLQETVRVGPNAPGDGVATVEVLQTRRPVLGPVTGVSVAVGSRAAAPARHVAATRWVAGVRLTGSGPTTITVIVDRRSLPPTSATFDWVVGPPVSAPARVVSRAPLAGPLQLLAAALTVGLLMLLAQQLRRRPRSRPRLDPKHAADPATADVEPAELRGEPALRT